MLSRLGSIAVVVVAASVVLTPSAADAAGKARPGLAVSCEPAAVQSGHAVNCTVLATDEKGGGAPTGAVTVKGNKGAVSAASCTLAATSASDSACAVDYTPRVDGEPMRTDYVTAFYLGDPRFAAVTAQTHLAVTRKQQPGLTLTCAPGSPANTTTTCTLTSTPVSASNPVVPTGRATFAVAANEGSADHACTLSPRSVSPDSVQAACTVTYTSKGRSASGVDTITATYQGDRTFTSQRVTGTADFRTRPQPFFTLACGSPATVDEDDVCTITSQDADTDPSELGEPHDVPSGVVDFAVPTAAGAITSSCALTVTNLNPPPGFYSSCSVTLTPLAPGTITVTATYGGDAGFGPETDTTSVSVASVS